MRTVGTLGIKVCVFCFVCQDYVVAYKPQITSLGIATLLDGDEQVLGRAWAWTLWECDIDLSESSHQLVCKATDNSYSNQPDTVKGIWNLRYVPI